MVVTVKKKENIQAGCGLRVLGVDPSTKTGVVYLSECEPEATLVWALQHKPEPDRFRRWEQYALNMANIIDSTNPDFVMIEGYGYANAHTLGTLVEVGTYLRKVIYDKKVPFIEVPPNSLKQFVAGAGNAKKDDMKLHTFKRWGFEHKSDDIVDAYGLARMGLALFDSDGLTATMVKSLSKVKEGDQYHWLKLSLGKGG